MLVKMTRHVCAVSETAEVGAGLLLMMEADGALVWALFATGVDEEANAAADEVEFFFRVAVHVDERVRQTFVLGGEGRCIGAQMRPEFEGSW